MAKYAMLVYQNEGVYSYIPLSNKDITLDEAVDKALNVIDKDNIMGISGDSEADFSIVEVGTETEYNTDDFDDYFKKKASERTAQNLKVIDELDKLHYERLKKKFKDKNDV